MKMYSFVAALLMPIASQTSLAQDHSQHRSSPPATATRDKPTAPAAENHSQHSTPAAASEAAKETSTESELRHIPPDPPEHAMPEMSEERMMELMEMDDTSKAGKVLLDQVEGYRADDSTVLAWDAQTWYGGDYNKLWVKTEGERVRGLTEHASAELLWNRIIARWWSVQSGIRHDFGDGPARTWGALGVEGLAPYWFDVEATLYVGEGGRAAARVKAEYELLFTQRLILQPDVEMNLYSKDDRDRSIGAGLSDLQIGLRLRYEMRREIAPFLGLSWAKRFGKTADLVHALGEESDKVHIVVGLRLWF